MKNENANISSYFCHTNMCISPVQILVKYLTDSSNCAFLCVDSSKKNFWSNSWNRFLPPRTESFCPSLCGEWAEFGRIVLLDGLQLAYKAQILTQNANLPPRTC